jgi:hypothetical protein
MWIMKTQLIREIVEEEASRLVPDEVNLWPVVSTRLAARERRWTIKRVVRRGVIVALLVFIIALLTSRQLQVVVAGVLAQVVGARGGPGQPTIFTPTPPFVVRQPGHLPPGFRQARMVYNPGFDPQTIPTAMALAGNPTPSGTAPAYEAQTLFEEIDKGANPSRAALLFIYRAEEGSELWLYERAALLDDRAGQRVDGQWQTLSWIEDGTWLALRGTIAHEELLRVAEGLVVTQRPSAGETGGLGFPGPMMDEHILSPVSLAEAQRQVPFRILLPTWLPDGLILNGAHVNPPNWVNIFYGRTEGGDAGFGIETAYDPREGGYLYPGAAKQQVMVNGQPAICVQGAWKDLQAKEWNDAADSGALEWSANGFTYHIGHSGLGLTCNDLIKIAESLR